MIFYTCLVLEYSVLQFAHFSKVRKFIRKTEASYLDLGIFVRVFTRTEKPSPTAHKAQKQSKAAQKPRSSLNQSKRPRSSLKQSRKLPRTLSSPEAIEKASRSNGNARRKCWNTVGLKPSSKSGQTVEVHAHCAGIQ